jgi:hypothetical protein
MSLQFESATRVTRQLATAARRVVVAVVAVRAATATTVVRTVATSSMSGQRPRVMFALRL